MRVLLFVEGANNKPPSCFHRYRSDPRSGGGREGEDWRLFIQCWRSEPWCSWWLVECENADAGRRLIALSSLPRGASISIEGPVPQGRVLASGGREA